MANQIKEANEVCKILGYLSNESNKSHAYEFCDLGITFFFFGNNANETILQQMICK